MVYPQISNSVPPQGCSFTQFLHAGVLSHSWLSARPPFSSAMPMLGGVPEHGVQPPETHLSILIFLPAYTVCIFIHLTQILLPGLWSWLSSAGGIEDQVMPFGCFWLCERVKREGREVVVWDCLLVRSQAPACFLMNPISPSISCLSTKPQGNGGFLNIGEMAAPHARRETKCAFHSSLNTW